MLPDPPAPGSNFSKEEFIAGVARCKEYIAAGDAFQIVLSQRFSVPFALPPFCAVSRAAADQSGAVPVLPGFRRVLDRRLLAGGAGAAARRDGDGPAAGGHAAARRDA